MINIMLLYVCAENGGKEKRRVRINAIFDDLTVAVGVTYVTQRRAPEGRQNYFARRT